MFLALMKNVAMYILLMYISVNRLNSGVSLHTFLETVTSDSGLSFF